MSVVVTGGTGFVGSNIVKVFAEAHGETVVVPTNTYVPTGAEYTHAPLDLTDGPAVARFMAQYEPSVIVHSAILNDFTRLYADRRAGWAHYVEATRHVVAAANTIGAKVILVSTDWVFDGTQSGADETTPPNPVNLYGVMKLASELVVTEAAVDGAVARVAGVNGVGWARSANPQSATPRSQDPGFGYFASWIVQALSTGEPFRVWESDDINMIATTTLASDAAEMMWRIADRKLHGIFHCVGGEAVSRRELALATCAAFDLDPSLLEFGPPTSDLLLGAPVPYDTTLNAAMTAAALDYELPDLETQLVRLRHQHQQGTLS